MHDINNVLLQQKKLKLSKMHCSYLLPNSLIDIMRVLSNLVHYNLISSKTARLHMNKSCCCHFPRLPLIKKLTCRVSNSQTLKLSNSQTRSPNRSQFVFLRSEPSFPFFLSVSTESGAAIRRGNSLACTRRAELPRFIKGIWSLMLSPLINLNCTTDRLSGNTHTHTHTHRHTHTDERGMRDVKRQRTKA